MNTHSRERSRSCRECGAPLGPQAPEGFCPACNLEGALKVFASPPLASDMPADPAVPLHEGLGTLFGDYELLEEIARGGMGIVYRARQRSLNRIVALKMILTGHLASKEEILRFRAEAETAARLHHPNIVAVHETGEHQGQHYFSMDFVQGRSLAEVVREGGPLPSMRTAAYVQTIAEAIAYAHDQGVLHRDLKPSNVLIDADDQPRITDFGLAKHMRDEFGLTVTGQLLGSPNFMPPEQAAGHMGDLASRTLATGEPRGSAAVDRRPPSSELRTPISAPRARPGPATDVYGIGAILYHLLTGRPPFQAATILEVLVQLRENEPVSPRKLNPSVPRDLETICLRCLEKEPARRYGSAREVADELNRFLEGSPTRARPLLPMERVWRWCKRRPALATLSALVVGLVGLVVIGAPVAAVRINAAKLEAARSLYAAEMRIAGDAVRDGALDHAREMLKHYIPANGAPDRRGLEWRYLQHAVEEVKPVAVLEGLPAPSGWDDTKLVRSGDFLYNLSGNKLLAWEMNTWRPVPLVRLATSPSAEWRWDPAQAKAYAVDPEQHRLTVYSLPHFEPGPNLPLPGPVTVLRLSDDGRRLAVGFRRDNVDQVLVWDLDRNQRLGLFGSSEKPVPFLAFSRDSSRLAAAAKDGVIGLWDLKNHESLPIPPPGKVASIHFTFDGSRLLCNSGTELTFWDIGERRSVRVEYDGRFPWVVGRTHDARFFIVDGRDGFLTLLDSQTLLPRRALSAPRCGAGIIACSPDDKLLVGASPNQVARLWDLTTSQEVAVIEGSGERVACAEFSSDGRYLILIGGFGKIRVYGLGEVTHRGVFAMAAGKGEFIQLKLSPDDGLLAAITIQGTVDLWERSSGRLIRSTDFGRFTYRSHPRIDFSPDGQWLAAVTGHKLAIMAIGSGDVKEISIEGNQEAMAITFSPRGEEIAFSCGRELQLYDMALQTRQRFAATEDEVFAIAYSTNGNLLAYGDRRGTVRVTERRSGRLLSEMRNAHPPHVYGLNFSPDGRLLGSSGADSTIKLWSVLSDGRLQEPPQVLRGHRGYVDMMAFSPNGSRLVSTSADQTLKIWDPQRAEQLLTLYGHRDLVAAVEFTKDGNTFYSASTDGEVRVWEAPPLSSFKSLEQSLR